MITFLLLLIFSTLAGLIGYYYGRTSMQEAPAANQAQIKIAAVEVTEETSEPIEVEPVEVLSTEAPQAENSVEPNFSKRSARSMQTLTDAQGRRIEAKVLSVEGDAVKIRRSDGLETSFPLSILIPKDIAFCEYLRTHSPTTQKATSKATSTDDIDWDMLFGE